MKALLINAFDESFLETLYGKLIVSLKHFGGGGGGGVFKFS